ncbi:flagellar assembly protein FliH [Gilliamella sp. Bif1-4]|uniref:flagellar assembly protein FliH n=1 Tax=Gilliamella sp. Bif1-4 TaxID=3120233 RepID=UPI00159EE30D|nr:flagellar assembly protein FliH [Gilliamella apicola]
MCNRPDRLNWEPLNFQDFSLSELPKLSKNEVAINVETDEPETELAATEIDNVVIESELNQAQQLEQLKEEVKKQAYQDGFNLGQQEGFNVGKQTGYDEGYQIGEQEGRQFIEQQLNEEKLNAVQAIANLITNFQNSINEIDELIVPKLLDLALIAAQKTVGTIPKAKQKQLIYTIKTLVEQCSVLSEPIALHLNPADLLWLEPMLNDEISQYHWQLIADPNVEQGGCKIFTETNEIDANIEQHWQIMSDSLKEDNH